MEREQRDLLSRPAFLKQWGALVLVGAGLSPSDVKLSAADREILRAALIAEALAVTTYAQIVAHAPFFTRLFPQDQTYLRAAQQQEMAHYSLLSSVLHEQVSVSRFYYPEGMFSNGARTVETLVQLEEAFIAAYLVAVQRLESSDLRMAAARIMGVESDHRTMARVLAPNLDPVDGGPLRKVRGVLGAAEPVDPASNNSFERTLGWTQIGQAVQALHPYSDQKAAKAAGFDTKHAYPFVMFSIALPTGPGAF